MVQTQLELKWTIFEILKGQKNLWPIKNFYEIAFPTPEFI